MTDRLERRLPEVLTELALPRMPDYVDNLLSRTERMPQRPGWTFLERWFPVSTVTSVLPFGRRPALRPLLLVAALLALVIAALAFYVGTSKRLPPVFGPASNGLIVTTNAEGDLVSVNPATEASRTLVPGVTETNICCADVSPDGQRVAFGRIDVVSGEPTGLGVVNVDGSGLREYDSRLATFIEWLEWSPAGDRMLIANAAGPVIVDVPSGRETPIHVPFEVLRASWIGTTGDILLTERLDDAPTTSASFAIYRLAAGTTTGAVEVLRPQDAVDAPLVSPDGSKFLYFIWGPEDRLKGKIHVFDFASGTDVAVTPEVAVDRADITEWENALWSPDSASIAAELYTAADNHIAVIPATGTDTPVILGPTFPTGSGGAAIRFSPDGASLLVTYRFNNATWLLPVAGGEEKQLTWAVAEDMDWQRLAP